jgi:hypothetical protein
VLGVLLAACVATVSTGWNGARVVASDGCSLTDEVRATTCRLVDGETTEGTLDAAGGSATYRVDVLASDTTLELALAVAQGGIRLRLLDWRGAELGEAARGEAAQEAHLSARLDLPGAYGVRIDGDASATSAPYRLAATIRYPGLAGRPVWPPALLDVEAALAGERQVMRTPRGGTPEGGVAVARALGAPPDGDVGDFTLVADVQFEKIAGPSACTVRFRYEPEAGGGTGYVFSLDPFGGTASLDSFEEGQRRPIVAHRALPAMPTSDAPNRLVLRAEGPSIQATLDGQTVLEATDARYPRGLIAVGAVTWSDPVAVTFDHVQVTTPPR